MKVQAATTRRTADGKFVVIVTARATFETAAGAEALHSALLKQDANVMLEPVKEEA